MMQTTFKLEEKKIKIIPSITDNQGNLREFSFILDTGATVSVINEDVATRLGYDVRTLDKENLVTIGGKTVSRKLRLPKIELFGTVIENLDVRVIAMPFQVSMFLDGLIGMDFLLKLKYLKIDFEAQIIEV
jgi:clan AA aspartic protease (TIGR02281 family)